MAYESLFHLLDFKGSYDWIVITDIPFTFVNFIVNIVMILILLAADHQILKSSNGFKGEVGPFGRIFKEFRAD